MVVKYTKALKKVYALHFTDHISLRIYSQGGCCYSVAKSRSTL